MGNRKYLGAILGCIGSSMAEQVQILSTELGLCLTFSGEQTMVAYNPAVYNHAVYPVATWQPCIDSSPDQLFEYTPQFQLTSNNQCLTPLPISSNYHENLEPCDTWKNLPGAGTYLFFAECQQSSDTPSNPVTYQQFDYDVLTKRISSSCPHALFLGSQGEGPSNYKAFLTSDVEDSFSSAQVLSGFDLPVYDIISITQAKSDAVIEMLSEFLPDSEATAVIQHGCWCSRISGMSPHFVGDAIDDIDRLCRDWSKMRRCNTLQGGSCPAHASAIVEDYTIKRLDSSANLFSCDTAINLSDDCLRDSCLIDAAHALSIYQELEQDQDWSGVVKTEAECKGTAHVPVDTGSSGTSSGASSSTSDSGSVATGSSDSGTVTFNHDSTNSNTSNDDGQNTNTDSSLSQDSSDDTTNTDSNASSSVQDNNVGDTSNAVNSGVSETSNNANDNTSNHIWDTLWMPNADGTDNADTDNSDTTSDNNVVFNPVIDSSDNGQDSSSGTSSSGSDSTGDSDVSTDSGSSTTVHIYVKGCAGVAPGLVFVDLVEAEL